VLTALAANQEEADNL